MKFSVNDRKIGDEVLARPRIRLMSSRSSASISTCKVMPSIESSSISCTTNGRLIEAELVPLWNLAWVKSRVLCRTVSENRRVRMLSWSMSRSNPSSVGLMVSS